MSKTDTKTNISEEEIKKEEAESGKRVSGEPDSNLAAVGAGGISGAAAGAAIGTAVGGPIGGAVGAVAGAIAGGVAADQIQDELDPNLEEIYWRENYKNRPYYKSGDPYENYLPAYKYGWESAVRKEYRDRKFEDIESELQTHWVKNYGTVHDWKDVREKIRDAYLRIRERPSRK